MKNKTIVLLICAILTLCTLIFPVTAQVQDYGTVEFILRAGGSAEDTTIYLKQASDPSPFDPSFKYTGEAEDQNSGWYKIAIQPDGKSFPEYFNAGTYTAAMRNGNGGQPEYQDFTLFPGENKRVVFLGHAVACHGTVEPTAEPTAIPTITPTTKPTPRPTPTPASYCMLIKTHVDQYPYSCEFTRFAIQTEGADVQNNFGKLPVYKTVTVTEKYKERFLFWSFEKERSFTKTFTTGSGGVVIQDWYVPLHKHHISYTFGVRTDC